MGEEGPGEEGAGPLLTLQLPPGVGAALTEDGQELRGQRMGPGGTPVRSEGTCAARPRPQRSPSPASARTGPRGWSHSAEASGPCSLECRHSPAFASCRLWAGRAWAGGKQGSRQEISREPQVRAGHPRDPLPGRAQGLARCRCLCPVSGSLSPAGSPHSTHKQRQLSTESSSQLAKIPSF